MKMRPLATLALLAVVAGHPLPAATPGLVGDWACPAKVRLAGAGAHELALQVNTRSQLRADGRYRTEGEAVVAFSVWPMTLITTSAGQWRRDRQDMTLVVETLELSPGSPQGLEMQRYLIAQLQPRLPELPYTETVRIVEESADAFVIEDQFGEQVRCTRL
jgi:hypothetical protein